MVGNPRRHTESSSHTLTLLWHVDFAVRIHTKLKHQHQPSKILVQSSFFFSTPADSWLLKQSIVGFTNPKLNSPKSDYCLSTSNSNHQNTRLCPPQHASHVHGILQIFLGLLLLLLHHQSFFTTFHGNSNLQLFASNLQSFTNGFWIHIKANDWFNISTLQSLRPQ